MNSGGAKTTGGTVSSGGSRTTGGTPAQAELRAQWSRDPSGAAAWPMLRNFALIQLGLKNTTAVGALPTTVQQHQRRISPLARRLTDSPVSIALGCAEFAPMETRLVRKCEAVITSQCGESSYNPISVVTDRTLRVP